MEAYLDYNATTPVDPAVLEAMKPYLTQDFANASSVHRKGQAARHAVEHAREQVAACLAVEPGDIVFTSGGTEADNLALRGAMMLRLLERKHLVVSSIEHQAVLHPARYLAGLGCQVTYVPVTSDGIIDLDALKKSVTSETSLVSLMHVNNEIGTIQPIDEARKIAHDNGAYFHVDAVQSFGRLETHPEEQGIDLLTVSGHKICGPKGSGALYIRKGLKIKPILYGGHQEKNVRPGTENVPAIAGFGKAAELTAKNKPTESKRVAGLRDRLEQGILKKIERVRLNGDPKCRIYNTSNISFEGLDGETLLMNLDMKNICVSTGSACTAGSLEPSHVLIALGLTDKIARAAVRFSLGRFTTENEVDYVLSELPAIIERLRKNAT